MTAHDALHRAPTATATDAHFYNDGTLLVGTLTEVPHPVAAAVVIAGSGRVNRDTDVRRGRRGPMVLRTGVTRQVAEALATVNVAALRFDKRGIGASGGDYLRTGLTDNLADARAALRWLAARFPGLPLLAVGHSEGTLHAARLAADEPTVAGAVVLSAPARDGEQILRWQLDTLLPTLPTAVRLITRALRYDIAQAQRKRMERMKASTADVLRIGGARANVRWYREFMRHNPAADYARVTVPVLAITGGNDMQVPPTDVEVIGRLVRGPFEGHVVADLSHLLRPDPDRKGLRGYRRSLRQPVSPEALALMTAWAAKTWGGQPRLS